MSSLGFLLLNEISDRKDLFFDGHVLRRLIIAECWQFKLWIYFGVQGTFTFDRCSWWFYTNGWKPNKFVIEFDQREYFLVKIIHRAVWVFNRLSHATWKDPTAGLFDLGIIHTIYGMNVDTRVATRKEICKDIRVFSPAIRLRCCVGS